MLLSGVRICNIFEPGHRRGLQRRQGVAVAVERDRAGAAALTRLLEAFRLDDAALPRRLNEAVDPGLAAFSLSF
jgi:hypothetical protein